MKIYLLNCQNNILFLEKETDCKNGIFVGKFHLYYDIFSKSINICRFDLNFYGFDILIRCLSHEILHQILHELLGVKSSFWLDKIEEDKKWLI